MTTDAEHRETARALEIILSGIRLDNETAVRRRLDRLRLHQTQPQTKPLEKD